MTPQERLALALQYQKQRDLGSALPSTPAENAARPVQEPEQSWLNKLNEVASGVGYGGQNLVEALGQIVRHPGDALHSFTVGVGRAMDNPLPAAQATLENVKQYAENAASSPFNLGQAIGENISPRKLAAMLESPAVREIVAYHGTPHRFPATEANPLGEFDASKIGTGEGAQAYGHGVYLAESPEVSEVYRSSNNPIARKAEMALQAEGNVDKAIKYVQQEIKTYEKFKNEPFFNQESYQSKLDALDYLKQTKKGKKPQIGSLYSADLPDEMIDRMLDWDTSIKSQPENVRQAVEPFMNKYGVARTADIGTLISAMEREMPSVMVSEKLRDAGIPGIKYLDAGSRGTTGTGTRNFVVFPGEEKKVKILERK